MRKTKIVCTMGPNVDKDPMILEDMIKNGMNVARFNFSHGDYAEHEKRINLVKQTANKLEKTISLVLDTKGPEMRLGEFAGGKVFLKKGNKFMVIIYEEEDKYDSYDLGIVPENFDINNESHHKHIPFRFNKNSDYKYLYFPIEG